MERLYPDVFIYAPINTPRLAFIVQWIFEEQLQLKYWIMQNKQEWEEAEGIKIIYAQEPKSDDAIHILPHSLLNENFLEEKKVNIHRWKQSTILFYNQPGAAIPFDIFSAIFFLISRYEEYLPHNKDRHGRYDHQQSLGAQYSFLQQPVVDEWLFHFRSILQQKFNVRLPEREFRFQPTYDVDIAWKYLHKGSMRTWAAYVRDFVKLNWIEVWRRSRVISGRRKDPYDCFDWLDELHMQYQVKAIYFLLLGRLGAYDKNADPLSEAMQKLMHVLSNRHHVGIHPSYASGSDAALINEEIGIMSKAVGKMVQNSRQHYIKFALPETYERLVAAGITNDYSMGYPSRNGFRAGTSHSFLWYNLAKEELTPLRVHPFVFMDATSRFYERQNTNEAFAEWERLYHSVKKVNGTFISIWHNHLLANDRQNRVWSALYQRTLQVMFERPSSER